MRNGIILTALISLNCFAVDLVWEKDLTSHLNGMTDSGYVNTMTQLVDDGVGVVFYSGVNQIVLILDGAGSIRYTSEFSSLRKGGFRGRASLSRFCLGISTSDGGYYLSVYEYDGSAYTNTIIPVTNHSLPQHAGSASEFFYTLEGTILKKYQFAGEPSSLFGNIAAGIDGANFKLSWNTTPSEEYQIQSSDNLTNWVNIGEAITGTGATLNWATSIVSTSEFYRVILQ